MDRDTPGLTRYNVQTHFFSGMNPVNQFPKLHSSAKLGRLSGSHTITEFCFELSGSVYTEGESVTAICVGAHKGASYACRKCCVTARAG